MSTAGILAAEATPHATMKPAILTAALFAACCLASLIGRAVAEIPPREVARETVDLIEVNHFYDQEGRLVFDQVIFYDWSKDDARYMVRAWRLVKEPSQVPKRDWQAGGYTTLWHDGDLLRRVDATSFRESWTQYDPELVEREYLPREYRRELTTVRPWVKRREP
jgi:hypothetical protein